MLKDKAAAYSQEKNCNCAESTLLAAEEYYGFGNGAEDAAFVGGFGGGIGCGMTCGALCGSIAALGKLLLDGPAHTMPEFRALCAEYAGIFRENMGGTDCRDVKPNFAVPGLGCVKAIEKNAELLEAFIAAHGLAEKK